MKTSGFLAAASSVRIVLVPVIMALVAMDDRDVGTLSIVAGALQVQLAQGLLDVRDAGRGHAQF